LPSVRKKALGKEPFADEIFAECSLPSVTLGKAFAECKIVFAECLVILGFCTHLIKLKPANNSSGPAYAVGLAAGVWTKE
jgi:hypothetical protein